MLFPARTRESAAGHPRIFRALFAAALALGGAGCMWLDDFDKFKIGDAGTPDAQTGQGKADAGSGDRCRNVNCGKMDAECMRGMCDPQTGECKAVQVEDGQSCFDGNPCSSGDTCKAGECVGQPIDCSAWDLECSQGMCDPASGKCVFGPNMSQGCDDLNACTSGERCDQGLCRGGTNLAAGSKCDDFNECSGTADKPDQCDGKGVCERGAPVAAGTACDDENECTTNDKCSTSGNCDGTDAREGQSCQTACSTNTTCQSGECKPPADAATAYSPRCVLNLCNELTDLCQERWKNDRVCECGCGYDDADCKDECTPRMCASDAATNHKATRWCGQDGKAIDNCPDSLKGDGKCDCGCQFADPDCEGGACCSATGKSGCDNKFVEDCVCNHATSKDETCCGKDGGSWTDKCAKLAVNLGCMLCP